MAVILDQAEDLRRRLLEQETLLRAEADLQGVVPSRVEAALTSTRAAAHALETISSALPGELDQQRWIARHVARFASRLIDAAQEQLQSGATRASDGPPSLRMAYTTPGS
ncbi:hypothetical protein ON003_00325 [Janibacter hoylei]|uniref:hypothetical protein n=1 Tax=Janibacter hoylei TaxID=364298 RepID=UPI0022375021|nr:hypothetical protein [Janibacter hoylei]MCW4600228.1 hypothetical protein [Janibacter hoylei]